MDDWGTEIGSPTGGLSRSPEPFRTQTNQRHRELRLKSLCAVMTTPLRWDTPLTGTTVLPQKARVAWSGRTDHAPQGFSQRESYERHLHIPPWPEP